MNLRQLKRVVLSISIFLMAFSINAQENTAIAYMMVPTINSITFQEYTDQGTLGIVITIPGSFAVKDIGTADWIIPATDDFQISPNGQYVAFPAFRSETETAIFIYDFVTHNIEQINVPSLMTVTWSPNSEAFVLHPLLNSFIFEDSGPAPETFVYTLQSQEMVQVTSGTHEVEYEFIWIDNERFIYVGQGIPCSAPCRSEDDLYIGDRFGLNGSALTNLGAAITGGVFRSICKPHWSPTNQRIYFAVGCGYTGIHFEWLYSVDLAGNLRLEIDPLTLFQSAIDLNIQAIFSTPDSPVYIAVFSQDFDKGDVWRILQIDNLDNLLLVYEMIDPVEGYFLQTASLSPNGQYIALAGNELGLEANGGLAIIDLNSMGLVASKPAGTMDIACSMAWRDSQTLVYSQVEIGTCTRFNVSTATFSYDVVNNVTTPLVSGIGTAVALLPVPEISAISPSCTTTITDTSTLLSALTTANTTPEADTICLEEGTYTLTSANNTSDGANGLPVITSDITLHGLGAGAVITRQSGSPAFRILNVASGGNLVLNNLTISGGDAGSGSGGGIRNRGTLELVNTVIENNRGNGGGGIRNNDSATLIVTDSTIISNLSTSSGGGIYSNTGSITQITDTVISGNQANTSSGLGGGLFMNGAELTLSGGSFGANQARNGAGLFINNVTQPVTITGTQFINNNATNHGGGLYASVGTISLDGVAFIGNTATNIGGAVRNSANMTITNSTFTSNNGGASGGGGIANFGTLTLNTSTLDGNLVSTSSGNGGGVFNQGTLTVNGGTIQNGSARNGAGLFSDGGSALVDGVQIMTNTASNQGGGVYFNGVVANSHLNGSCITGNTAPTGSAAYSAVANFDATTNWWGASGSNGLVNSNVNASSPLASCTPASGQSLMMAPQNNTMQQSGTTQVVALPYSNAFDSALGWVAQGAWSRETIGGQAGATWVADASIRGLESTLETSFALDLPRNRTATLRYWQSGNLSAEDRVILEILPQGATVWVLVDEQVGLNATWGQREISLNNWRGQQVRLRWRLVAGSDTTTGIEYRLDELGITSR